jgi:hypothetical protein
MQMPTCKIHDPALRAAADTGPLGRSGGLPKSSLIESNSFLRSLPGIAPSTEAGPPHRSFSEAKNSKKAGGNYGKLREILRKRGNGERPELVACVSLRSLLLDVAPGSARGLRATKVGNGPQARQLEYEAFAVAGSSAGRSAGRALAPAVRPGRVRVRWGRQGRRVLRHRPGGEGHHRRRDDSGDDRCPCR